MYGQNSRAEGTQYSVMNFAPDPQKMAASCYSKFAPLLNASYVLMPF